MKLGFLACVALLFLHLVGFVTLSEGVLPRFIADMQDGGQSCILVVGCCVILVPVKVVERLVLLFLLSLLLLLLRQLIAVVIAVISFPAFIRVGKKRCVTTLITAAKEAIVVCDDVMTMMIMMMMGRIFLDSSFMALKAKNSSITTSAWGLAIMRSAHFWLWLMELIAGDQAFTNSQIKKLL